MIKSNADDKVAKIIKQIDEEYNEFFPELIFYVEGSKNTLNVDEEIKKAFKIALMKISKSTDAWIVTDGLDSGVVRLVGDAVAEDLDSENLTLLGIVPWGCVPYRHELIKPNEYGKIVVRSLECMKSKMQKNRYLNKQAVHQNTMVQINPNHTHFIFVDDGTVGQFGSEIKYRAEFRKGLSRYFNLAPMVLLVVEGDLETLKTILSTLRNGSPVLIIAVFVAFCFLTSNKIFPFANSVHNYLFQKGYKRMCGSCEKITRMQWSRQVV